MEETFVCTDCLRDLPAISYRIQARKYRVKRCVSCEKIKSTAILEKARDKNLLIKKDYLLSLYKKYDSYISHDKERNRIKDQFKRRTREGNDYCSQCGELVLKTKTNASVNVACLKLKNSNVYETSICCYACHCELISDIKQSYKLIP